MVFSDLDKKLCRALCDHPRRHEARYSSNARDSLLEILFRSLTNDRPEYLTQLFPNGFPSTYRLQDAQGVEEDAEYSAAAKGHPCGHILKHGEASYHCSTCTNDPTAVLCSRCFFASDHEGHQIHISLSQGNSGCCDCGDLEAWKRPVNCAIHTALEQSQTEGQPSELPEDLQVSIRTTISRALDYFCDIISCSPENLRLPKTMDSVKQDELMSRLTSKHYVSGDDVEINPEYCLIIWNDEKHTVREVQQQVARACRAREQFGRAKAQEADDIGRSIVTHSRDLKELIRMAKVIEEIKVTVTIRSSRDTFREQMCGTIAEWLNDIAGCSIDGDSDILRRVICEEMLQLWQVGSGAWNAKVGREDLDDHGDEESREEARRERLRYADPIHLALQRAMAADELDDISASDEELEVMEMIEIEQDDEEEGDDDDDREMQDTTPQDEIFDDNDANQSVQGQSIDLEATDDAEEVDTDGDIDFLDVAERIDNTEDFPTNPPVRATQQTVDTTDVPGGVQDLGGSANYHNVPKGRGVSSRLPPDAAPNHWMVLPHGYSSVKQNLPVYEDLTKNIRVDSMILFDLRLWKQTRTSLRDLYIGTVVKIAKFKRILGLRFSGLYTTLAQLYLVADREPDHSIINLSLQMFTTPSITEEVIEKGNFLTNLMAILYTFLTTRQVGFPGDVDPGAILGFDAGTVANRRLFHFFSDLKYFLASPFVQTKIRTERQYLFQYLDLAKLTQGICPNVRAVGEHVEYETDAWISASLLTRDINKLCRQFAETFYTSSFGPTISNDPIYEAISQTAGITIINALGLERKRFEQGEIKDIVRFHNIGPFLTNGEGPEYRVIQFAVEKGSLSFHHPLHYTLSWLLECGKDAPFTLTSLRDAAENVLGRIRQTVLSSRDSTIKNSLQSADDALLALFDYPLRVCAWLAQMRANMWVRNGMSLRHQMGQYRSVAYRDVGHQRDLFLLQTALVTCDPTIVLASMIDRFGLPGWMSDKFSSLPDCEDSQMLDLAEDFIYLLINLLSDRDALISKRDDPESQIVAVRKDIAHTLCFKPLSYSDLNARLTERAQDHDQLQEILEQMTRYRAPEGLHDSGLFELREEYLQELDPYNSHFTKNQRDEAENIYKKWMAKKMNKSPEDIVLEPKLHPIQSQVYNSLSSVVHTSLFAQVIYQALAYVAYGHKKKTNISSTRVEAFLQIVLQLCLIATLEDNSSEHDAGQEESSFAQNAMRPEKSSEPNHHSNIIHLLHRIWLMDDFSACRSKVRHLMRLFHLKLPQRFVHATQHLDFPAGRFDTASPANLENEIEAKKKQAMERKARVMAQFQQQQQSFMDKQGVIDWGDDDISDAEAELPSSKETRLWKYPAGLCIQCREDTTDSRLYGTFAMITDAHMLRQTCVNDPDFVQEAMSVPENLDRSNESNRPFGVSGANREEVTQLSTDGHKITVQRQGLGKGWPKDATMKGPVATSCGHIMHFACFENYYQSVNRRHSQQVARNHPERVVVKEFVCPLCKALANSFLPIVWKHTEQSYPGALEARNSFQEFLETQLEPVEVEGQEGDEIVDAKAMQIHREVLTTFAYTALTPLIERSQSGEIVISPTSQGWAERQELEPFTQLASIYGRLKDPLLINTQNAQPYSRRPDWQANHFQMLINTLANTITAVETAYRGREAEYGMSLLSGIPQQTLSHLQILAATIRSYAATGAISIRGSVDAQYRELYKLTSSQLRGQTIARETGNSQKTASSLLQTDSFQYFVQASTVLCPVENLDLRHMLTLTLMSEILRVMIAFTTSPTSLMTAVARHADADKITNDLEIHSIETVFLWFERCLSQFYAEDSEDLKDFREIKTLLGVSGAAMLMKLIKTYCLGFLRKATVLFHVAYGVDFPVTAGTEAGLSELDRLLHLLQLPSISGILTEFSEFPGNPALKSCASAWVKDWVEHSDAKRLANSQSLSSSFHGIKLLHPAPLELIGLPKYFDVLHEESHKRKCPTTGKELTDPALCLFCGEIFCSQAVCCMTQELRGGCNSHIEKCSSPIGMFLFIRKCHVVLLHVVKDPKMLEANRERVERGYQSLPSVALTISHGSFFPAPYLTKHGETDSGLRSRNQLILNQKRYDKLLRDTWLMTNGSVWSTVARKLESEVNAGGWETL